MGKYAATYSCVLVTARGWDGWNGWDWNIQFVGMFWVGWLILCDTASVVDDSHATSGWVTDVIWRSEIGSLGGKVTCR